ncbi:MAG: hypothetical protein H5T97_14225, partial [Firmicutes bacterium]|nr:hypothetical protein [Bacillota bacterium]
TTHHLWQVGEILGIPLADHIILGATSWVSLAELGLLEPPKKP